MEGSSRGGAEEMEEMDEDTGGLMAIVQNSVTMTQPNYNEG